MATSKKRITPIVSIPTEFSAFIADAEVMGFTKSDARAIVVQAKYSHQDKGGDPLVHLYEAIASFCSVNDVEVVVTPPRDGHGARVQRVPPEPIHDRHATTLPPPMHASQDVRIQQLKTPSVRRVELLHAAYVCTDSAQRALEAEDVDGAINSLNSALTMLTNIAYAVRHDTLPDGIPAVLQPRESGENVLDLSAVDEWLRKETST